MCAKRILSGKEKNPHRQTAQNPALSWDGCLCAVLCGIMYQGFLQSVSLHVLGLGALLHLNCNIPRIFLLEKSVDGKIYFLPFSKPILFLANPLLKPDTHPSPETLHASRVDLGSFFNIIKITLRFRWDDQSLNYSKTGCSGYLTISEATPGKMNSYVTSGMI